MRSPTGEPTVVSLFSGCGGLDCGLESAGYRVIASVDIEPTALATHDLNLRGRSVRHDLTRGLPAAILTAAPTMVTLGSPCQGFSLIGRRDPGDPRNSLLLTGGRLALALAPQVILVENVPGARSGPNARYWHALRHLLQAADYDVMELNAKASDVGLPQVRKRSFLIAWNTGGMPATIETLAPVPIDSLMSGVRDVANHEPRALPVGGPLRSVARHMRRGQKLTDVRDGEGAVHSWDIPEAFGVTTAFERRVLLCLLRERRRLRTRSTGDADPVDAKRLSLSVGASVGATLVGLAGRGYVRKRNGGWDLARTFNGKARRLASDQLSPAVDTHYGDPWMFLHPRAARGFTVREAARLQGFPDNFRFLGTAREQFRQVGNAVPPPLGRALGRAIRPLFADR